MRPYLPVSLLSLAAVSHGRPSLKPRVSTTLLDNIKETWNAGGPEIPGVVNLAVTNNQGQDNNNSPKGKPAGEPQGPAEYSCFGPMMADFPPVERWVPFEKLWEINEDVITTANTQDGNKYNTILKNMILEVAEETGVNAEIILAMIMQESHGNVRVGKTPELCKDPDCDYGLMQVGSGRSFEESDPEGSIKNMILDGVHGTGTPDTPGNWTPGILPYWNSEVKWKMVLESGWQGNPYAAVHIYNDGNIISLDLTKSSRGVNYYAHDIVNRLIGWTGHPGGCEMARACVNFSEKPCY